MRLIIKPEWEVIAPHPSALANKCLHCRTSGAGHRLTTELPAAIVVPYFYGHFFGWNATHALLDDEWGGVETQEIYDIQKMTQKKNKNVVLSHLCLHYWYKVPVLHIIEYHFRARSNK